MSGQLFVLKEMILYKIDLQILNLPKDFVQLRLNKAPILIFDANSLPKTNILQIYIYATDLS